MGRKQFWVPVILAVAALAGCREGGETERAGTVVHDTFHASPPETYAYDCDDGTAVVAHYENRAGRDEVVLFLPARTLRLPATPAASGARYGDDDVTWWSKGPEEATLTLEGAEPCLCRLNPARTRWEDAKLRGVDYRALGNEPGWVLEMGPADILLVSDYGETRLRFPLVEPETDAAAPSSTWRTESGGHTLVITIYGEPCVDDGDLEYPSRVELVLDDRVLPGCGRALH